MNTSHRAWLGLRFLTAMDEAPHYAGRDFLLEFLLASTDLSDHEQAFIRERFSGSDRARELLTTLQRELVSNPEAAMGERTRRIA